MERYQIQSNKLAVSIASFGAEITSIKSKAQQTEFMWDANPEIWNRHAPILFPFVGKLNRGKYTFQEKTYQLGQHGFARDMEFEVVEIYTDFIRLMLTSNEKTSENYPFEFKLFVSYKVIEDTVEVKYEVLNLGVQNMYFSIGAHPGFLLPKQDLSEFAIVFNRVEPNLQRHLIEEGLLNHQTSSVILTEENMFKLNSMSFQGDALVFKHLHSNEITLKHLNSHWSVKMAFEGFPFFGIWAKFPTQAFVCLEPWAGIADSVTFEGNLQEKEGILNLGPGSQMEFNYQLTFSDC